MIASELYVSGVLTDVMIGSRLNRANSLSSKLFPVVKVDQQSGKYFEMPRGDAFRAQAQKRGDIQESAGMTMNIESKDAYTCEPYALHIDIGDYTYLRAGRTFDLDSAAARLTGDNVWLKREIEFLDKTFKTGKWSLDVTPSVKWDNPLATIWKDIRTRMTDFKERNGGLAANKIIFQERVWDAIQDNPDLMDRVKGGATTANPAQVTQENVARVLGLEEVVIADAVQTSTNPGQPTQTVSFVSGEHALLVHTAKAPGIFVPSAGYTFVWNDPLLGGTGPEGERVVRMRLDTKRAWRIESEANWDHRVLAPDLGVFFHDCLT